MHAYSTLCLYIVQDDLHVHVLIDTLACLATPLPSLSFYRDFTRPDLPAGDPTDQATLPDLSAYGEFLSAHFAC